MDAVDWRVTGYIVDPRVFREDRADAREEAGSLQYTYSRIIGC